MPTDNASPTTILACEPVESRSVTRCEVDQVAFSFLIFLRDGRALGTVFSACPVASCTIRKAIWLRSSRTFTGFFFGVFAIPLTLPGNSRSGKCGKVSWDLKLIHYPTPCIRNNSN